MNLPDSHPNDFIIGKVKYLCETNTYNIKVSHVGIKNKANYNDFENVKIKNGIPKYIIGKKVKCTIQYRDEYNRLLCTVEEYKK